MLNGKSILVTGGTGSFGQEFVRIALERYEPAKIVVFSRDELKQYEMGQRFADDRVRYVLGDVRDLQSIKRRAKGIDILIHAAALKQVPTAEHNPLEAIKTNILGAENVIEAAVSAGVARVVALSTDKAANPINLYGATKLVSDKLFVAANADADVPDARFSVVRYGNVFTSRGSVVPYFRQLRAAGARSLPITDRRMTRFWITLGQGVDFVFSCLERMHGGEIFVPKLPSVRMIDVAEAVAPGLAVKIIGIRPGEKLHETLCPRDESRRTLQFADHYTIYPEILMPAADYSCDRSGEHGAPVDDSFEYNSGTNVRFLSVNELRTQLGDR